jgi:hypothetical protein
MRTESDEHLVRYLLGELPDAEAEALDARSITEDAFALRLSELENDLVDRVARGGPVDDQLARFQSASLQSSYLRQRIEVAEALHHAVGERAVPDSPPPRSPMSIPLGWGALASAATVLLALTAFLVLRTVQMREELAEARNSQGIVDQQIVEMQHELERFRAAARPPNVATFVLAAPGRSAAEPAPLVIPRGTDRLALRLPVESDGYERFWVALKDPATGRAVWRSEDVQPASSAGDRSLTVTVPASVFAAQRYTVELVAPGRTGVSEIVASYAVRIMLE